MTEQKDLEFLLSFQKQGGSYVKTEAAADDDFVRQLASYSQKECKLLLEMALAQKIHPVLGQLGSQHIIHILRRSKELDQKAKEAKPEPFSVIVKEDAKTRITTYGHTGYHLIDLDCGYEERTPHAMYQRMFSMSVGFSKSSSDHAVRQVTLPKSTDQAKQFTQDLTNPSLVARQVMGGAKSVPELEEEAGAFLKTKGIMEKMPLLFQSSIPEKLRSCVVNVESRLNNNKAMVIPDKHLRANSQLFAKVATTDKYGPGYYNQGHYDGTDLRGPIRNTYEMLCDFDYNATPPVVRLTSSDPSKAYALFNACKKKGRDVIVAYQSKTSGKVGDYWSDGKPKKFGVVPCDNITFAALMKGHEEAVYYYDLSAPAGAPKYNPLNVYKANLKLVEKVNVLKQYGYYSFYTNTSYLITKDELKECGKINTEFSESNVLMNGFSPSCKVRNGLVRVTSTGSMDYMAAFVNVIAGRLHYLTWYYRCQPFAYEKAPGDVNFQPVDVFVDINNPDDATANSKSILDGIWSSLPDHVQAQIQSEGIYRDEDSKPSDDDEEKEEEEQHDVVSALVGTFTAAVQADKSDGA